MPRDLDAIRASAAAADSSVLTAQVRGFPPGHFQGFYLGLSGQVLQVGPGEANIWGTEVIYDSTTDITERDWGVTRAPQKTYYVYLKKDGQLWVDNIDPEFVATANGEYHPILNYRYIGKFFVSSAGRIVFYLSAHYNSPEVITVGADDYTGYANYYCDGVEDEVELVDAATYISEGLVSGQMQLLGNAFNVSTQMNWLSGVHLDGGLATVSFSSNPTYAITLPANAANIRFANITLASTGNTASIVALSGISDFVAEGVRFSGGGIYIANTATRVMIRNCWTTDPAAGSPMSAFYMADATDVTISDCTVDGTPYGGSGEGIYLSSCRNIRISGCTIRDYLGTTGAAVRVTNSSGVTITDLVIRDVTHTVSTTNPGVRFSGTCTRCSVRNVTITDVCEISGSAITADPAVKIESGSVDTLIANVSATNNGNLVDRANCGSSTAPMIRGESSGGSSGCTFAMTNSVYYDGSASYGLTKTTTTLPGLVHLVSNTTSGLHGIVAGTTYGLRAWGYTTGAASASECFMFMRYTTAASNWTYGYISNTGTFCGFSLSVTIEATASQFSWGFGVATTAASGEVFNVDHIRLFPIGQHNEHGQQFVDSGTGTRESGNSWQSPFEA